MAADVNVAKVEFLKTYCGRINGLRNDTTLLATGLRCVEIPKIKKKYEELLRDMQRMQQGGEEDTRYIKDRYQRAINICGEDSREVIGNDDMLAEQKLEILQLKYESLRQHILDMLTKLENAGLKTQDYGFQINTLTDACIGSVRQYTDILEQANSVKK